MRTRSLETTQRQLKNLRLHSIMVGHARGRLNYAKSYHGSSFVKIQINNTKSWFGWKPKYFIDYVATKREWAYHVVISLQFVRGMKQ
jgi:hypothetical protein